MLSIRKIWAVARVSLLELLRRRDVYVALILAVVLVVPLSTVNFFGVEGIVRHLREVSLLLIWLFSVVIAITTAARQIPGELQRRTILPLLARPIRRSEVVLGKYVGSALAASAALLLFYLCYVLLTGLLSEPQAETTRMQATLMHMDMTMGQAILMHLAFVWLLTAMTMAGSLILTVSANLTCCALVAVGMLLFGEQLPKIADQAVFPASWIVRLAHYVLPHFEFYDSRVRLIHEWGAYDWGVLAIVLLYTLLYIAFLMIFSTLVFNRKRL